VADNAPGVDGRKSLERKPMAFFLVVDPGCQGLF
jgi:hypothetical protein